MAHKKGYSRPTRGNKRGGDVMGNSEHFFDKMRWKTNGTIPVSKHYPILACSKEGKIAGLG